MKFIASAPPHPLDQPTDDVSSRVFDALPRRATIVLAAIIAIIIVMDIVLAVTQADTTWQELVVSILAAAVTLLFAWRPNVAAAGVLILALTQTMSGHGGGEILWAAVALGLVVYTSPGWFSAIYGVALALIVALAWTSTNILTNSALPGLALVCLISAIIGAALRVAHRREARAISEVARFAAERDAQLRTERERIADELHDIIAHDVTLVAMHVRVLERVTDDDLRARSIEAIRLSADQALADIRRVLRIVRDTHPVVTGGPDVKTPETVEQVVQDARNALVKLGARVTVAAPEGVVLSASIEQAIVHVLREGSTNVAKHGGSAPEVLIEMCGEGNDVVVEIRNTFPPRPDLLVTTLSSGYGLDRLRERVALLGGELTAGAIGGSWHIRAQLPRM